METDNKNEIKNDNTKKLYDKPLVQKSTIIWIFILLFIIFSLISFAGYIDSNSEEIVNGIEEMINISENNT